MKGENNGKRRRLANILKRKKPNAVRAKIATTGVQRLVKQNGVTRIYAQDQNPKSSTRGQIVRLV